MRMNATISQSGRSDRLALDLAPDGVVNLS
jgi:hypothetical protein